MDFLNLTLWGIAVALIMITIILFYFLRCLRLIDNKIKELENGSNKSNRVVKRKHSNINPVNFSSTIKARKNPYEEYQNKQGLYEPVTPSKGIRIKEAK